LREKGAQTIALAAVRAPSSQTTAQAFHRKNGISSSDASIGWTRAGRRPAADWV
jgi:hypothetical protein